MIWIEIFINCWRHLFSLGWCSAAGARLRHDFAFLFCSSWTKERKRREDISNERATIAGFLRITIQSLPKPSFRTDEYHLLAELKVELVDYEAIFHPGKHKTLRLSRTGISFFGMPLICIKSVRFLITYNSACAYTVIKELKKRRPT